jgi:hypothetical protein
MSSKGDGSGSNGKSAITLIAETIEQTALFVDSVEHRLVDDVLPATHRALASAATAMARVQDEIDDLWRDAVKVDNEPLSDRLVDVSHALQRAARLLEEERAIG